MPMDNDPRFTSPSQAAQTLQACQQLVRELEARLEDSEETLGAIRRGEIDALVIGDVATAHQVYTLENADRPYRMLIEQIQEGAVTLSADGTVFYCNQRLAEMFGTLQEQVIGHKVQPFLRPGNLASFERLLETAHHGSARGECTIRNPNGMECPATADPANHQRLPDTFPN
jgi:PAS domain S-box-containing protein